MKYVLTLTFVFVSLIHLPGSIFYLDPSTGDASNTGGIDDPLPGLEESISLNLIESHARSLPYDVNGTLSLKNLGGLISGGDTLVLMDGLHGKCFLRNYVNQEVITIMGMNKEGAILEEIRIQGGKNWSFENLTVDREAYGNLDQTRLVYFESHGFQGPASHIVIENCVLRSASEPWTAAEEWLSKSCDGIYMRGDSMSALGNEVSNINMGITAYGDGIIVAQNKIINFSGDGARILGSGIVMEYNVIKNCFKVDDNHDDGIQSFTNNGIVVDNNIIRGNIIINQEDPEQALYGPLQGIGCFDGMYNNWLIENNVIHVNHWHGISLYGANDCIIRNNTVIDPSPGVTPGSSWIRIQDHKDGRPSSNCIVANNVSNKVIVDAQEINNFVVAELSEYTEHFVNAAKQDFHLLEGSPLVDAGDPTNSPLIDIEGVARNQGGGPDIGAYELDVSSRVDEALQDEPYVYPNPVSNELWIRNAGSLNAIQVYNSLGQLIYTSYDKLEIGGGVLSKWMAGHYVLLLLENDSNTVKILPFIKF